MAIITEVTKKDDVLTFKPIILNVQITINTKESLKELHGEYKIGDLQNSYLLDNNGNEELPLLTSILQQIEKAL